MKKEIIDYSKDYKAYCELAKHIRKACIANIRSYMDNLNTSELEVAATEAYGDYTIISGSLYIAYDGGNHPEYASNMFSEVESIEVAETNCIIVKTEDGLMCEDFMSLDDLQAIEEYLRWYSNEWLPSQENE